MTIRQQGEQISHRVVGTTTTRERLLAAVADLGSDELEAVALVAERLVAGAGHYGRLDLATDRRDFRHEASEELLDGIAYAAMDALRARRSGSLIERARQAARDLKAACGAAVAAEEREAIARLLADLTGDTGASLTERALADVLDSGGGGR
jgi:hypothetical protein